MLGKFSRYLAGALFGLVAGWLLLAAALIIVTYFAGDDALPM